LINKIGEVNIEKATEKKNQIWNINYKTHNLVGGASSMQQKIARKENGK